MEREAVRASAKKLLLVSTRALIFLVGFDLVGIFVSSAYDFLDSLFGGSTDPGDWTFYAIWFVDGIFCGLFAYRTSDQAESKPGGLIIVATAALATAFSLLLSRVGWDDPSSTTVPFSAPLTLTYFGSVVAGLIVARHAAVPSDRQAPGPSPRPPAV